jgi:hypothetical protein
VAFSFGKPVPCRRFVFARNSLECVSASFKAGKPKNKDKKDKKGSLFSVKIDEFTRFEHCKRVVFLLSGL